MNRNEFIKSFAVLMAAPALMKDLPAEVPLKKSYYFAITEEMRSDVNYMEYILSYTDSFVWKGCKAKGIDLTKEYLIQIGFNGADDFKRNYLTGIITQ